MEGISVNYKEAAWDLKEKERRIETAFDFLFELTLEHIKDEKLKNNSMSMNIVINKNYEPNIY